MNTINRLHSNSKLLMLFVVSAFLVFATSACNDDDDNPTEPDNDMNIVEIAQANSNLSSLVDAVSNAGLVSTLEGEGPFTLFAPTNQAFEDASDLISSLDEGQIKDVLKYHVAAAKALSGDLSDGQTIATLQGEDITVNIDGDGNVTLNGSVSVTSVDMEGTNGVVHVIDGLLVPPSMQPRNIVETAQDSDKLSTLVDKISTAGLVDALSAADSTYTVFAPTNDAFSKLPSDLNLTSDQLKNILTYHVLTSELKAADLQPKQTAAALNGENLFVTTGSNGAFVNQSSEITTTDVNASNGVIHLVNKVLMPNTFLDVVQIAQKNYKLTKLVDVVTDAGLASTLKDENSKFTVFAPTNQAFEDASSTIEGLSDNELKKVLQYHVAAAEKLSGDLQDGDMIPTVQGDKISVSVNNDGNVTLNGSVNVKTVDLKGINGVVHIIDGILIPPSM